MFDDEIYDPVLEELKDISVSMRELQKLISQEISIANANNILLRKLLEQQSKKDNENKIANLQINKFMHKNLLIINPSKEVGLEIAKQVTSNLEGNFSVSEAKSDSELAALVNNLSDGDIVFVDVSDPLFDNKMARVLLECVKDYCINIPIGQGAAARNVRIEVPKVQFIIYTYLEEFLTSEIKNLLMRVE